MKKIFLTLSIFCFAFFYSQKNQNYVEISYASICCGPPSADPVVNYVTQFQKKNKLKSLEVLQRSGLGREGEFSLYIGVDKLSRTQKNKFIKGLKSAINSQNSKRDENKDGIVNFDSTMLIKKEDLAGKRKLTIYKKQNSN
ncbi:hypothetical protein HNP38_001088 [Chryseobacterium defluvii]|uniref:Uncharacterized protein n=1 Tax=Chryseobacterium defluvii TaxID=160396 RepID=A0A840K9B8_9FLAO|nr:hypothetical protein [Chryseobacterium defluvii]MBB4805816.1 hypothetical protein [Chryseobacterium defluvii]